MPLRSGAASRTHVTPLRGRGAASGAAFDNPPQAATTTPAARTASLTAYTLLLRPLARSARPGCQRARIACLRRSQRLNATLGGSTHAASGRAWRGRPAALRARCVALGGAL